jgi:hypothetical protein
VPINAEKYQQRRHQEATADTDSQSQRQQREDTERDISDRQIDS